MPFGEREYLQGRIAHEDIPETITRPTALGIAVDFVQVIGEEGGIADVSSLDQAIGFKVVPLTPEQIEVVISVGSQQGKPYSSFDFYIKALLRDVRRYWPDLLEQTEPLLDTGNHQSDAYSNYETGLHQLRSRVKQDHPRYSDFSVYQQRLTENIAKSRLYGDTELYRAERSEIVDRLNELSLSVLNIPFTDLCGLGSSTTGREPSSAVANDG